jgi:hypothetical protein
VLDLSPAPRGMLTMGEEVMDIEMALRTFKLSLTPQLSDRERPLTVAECVMVAVAESVGRMERIVAGPVGPNAFAIAAAADALHDLISLYEATPGRDPRFVQKGKTALAGLTGRIASPPRDVSVLLCPKCGRVGPPPPGWHPTEAEQARLRAEGKCVECGRVKP